MHEEPHDSAGRRRRRRHRHRERKERVLHTRISEQLADDIRTIAEDLRVPVSNLVRNVLEEAFSAVESVTDNVGDLIDDVVLEAERARERVRRRRGAERGRRADPGPAEEPRAPEPATVSRDPFPDVVGWQSLVLNRPRACADCEVPLAVGERAFVGFAETGLSPHTLCADCMDARR